MPSMAAQITTKTSAVVLICSTDGLLCLRSATTSVWHARCRRGPFSNRSSPVKLPVYVARPGHGSLRGQRGLPQHLVRSGGQALQGPQRAYVDTRPPARRAIACTLALGRCVLEYLTWLMRYAAMAGSAQRNGSPDRQTLCRMTDSLRAKATRALPEPERRPIASAQCGRFTR